MEDIVIELKRERAEVIKRMETILTTSETEKRNFTEAEETEYKSLEGKLDTFDAKIARAEKVAQRRQQIEVVQEPFQAPNVIRKVENDMEFKSLPDFITAVVKTLMTRKRDPRLDSVEYREQSMGTGSAGGFAVPSQFRPELMALTPDGQIVRARATVIPAGDPPDSEVIIPALDQTSSQNMFGGVSVTWIAEGARKPETSLKIRQIKLTPHEVAAHIVVTDKLMRNWEAIGALASNQLRGAIRESEEEKFINGIGAGCPLGILNSSAIIIQTRGTANQVGYADVVNMYSKFYQSMGAPVWVASPTIIPQLAQMVDASSHIIWQPSAREGTPATLMGFPITYRYRQPGLGVTGDLMLCDFSAYLIKDGSGPFVGMSDQVYYLDNKTVIKAFWNVDGSPWLTEPIAPSTLNSTALASPFVVLSSQV